MELLAVFAVLYVLVGPLIALIIAAGAKSRARQAEEAGKQQARLLTALQGRLDYLQVRYDELTRAFQRQAAPQADVAAATTTTAVPVAAAPEPVVTPAPQQAAPPAETPVDVILTFDRDIAETARPAVIRSTAEPAAPPPAPAPAVAPLALELEPIAEPVIEPVAASIEAPVEAAVEPEAPPPPASTPPQRPPQRQPVPGEWRMPEYVTPAPAAATAAAAPPRHEVPGLFDRLITAGREWLFGGNLVAKAGLVILFIGAAFLVRLTASRYTIPPEFWLAAIAAGAIGLLAFGWRIRERRRGIGLPVQGAALALLMLVTFGGYKFFAVMPAGAAFMLLLVLVAFTCVLAVLQDALWLAVFGIAGGFAVPILTSTGQGSHVALFSYYALLNSGILAIALRRAWRSLNLLGFAFTFIIGTAWGVQRYVPEHYATSQAFLALFVLFYIAIAVLYAFRRAPQLKSYVDGALVFGVPMVASGLQYGMVKDIEYGMAFSALAFGLLYAVLASVLWRWRRGNLRLLVESFFAMAVVFGTLAIPLAFDGRWTSAAWALEGAGIVWVGLRQRQPLAWRFGIAVQIGSWIAFLAALFGLRPADVLANNIGLGFGLLGVTGVFLALVLRDHARRVADDPAEQRNRFAFVAGGFITVAALWLLAGLWVEVWFRMDGAERASLLVLTALGLVAGLHLLANRAAWRLPDMLGGAVAAIAGVTFVALVARHMTWSNAVDYAQTGLGELLRNGPLIGGLLLSGAALVTALAFNRPRDAGAAPGNSATGWWAIAVFWWCGFALHGLSHAVAWMTYGTDGTPWYRVGFFAAYSIGLALSAAAWTWIAQRRALPMHERIAAVFWPALSALAAFVYFQQVRYGLALDQLLRLDAVIPPELPRTEPLRAFAGGPLSGGLVLCALAWFAAGVHRLREREPASPRAIWLLGLGICLYAFVLDPLALFSARLLGGDVYAGEQAWQLGYPQTQLLWAGASAVFALLLARRRENPALRWLALPFLALQAFASVVVLSILYLRGMLPPPSTWIALLGAWCALAACIRLWQQAGGTLTDTLLRGLHIGRVIAPWAMLAPVVSLYAARWLFAADAGSMDEGWIVAGQWPDYLGAWVALAASFALLRQARADRWPVAPLGSWYAHGLLPFAAGWAVLLALYWNLRQDGSMAPLPYLPVLNPLDVTTGFCALFAAAVWRANRERLADAQRTLALRAAAWLGYLWFNLMLLRTAAAYLGLPYRFDALYESQFVQAMLSLVWTLSAFALMRHAVRRLSKPLWMVGAAFLAVVVAKLFLVDLSNVGSVARIVSFMGVGGLMLLIGYLAPLPRAASAPDADAVAAGGRA